MDEPNPQRTQRGGQLAFECASGLRINELRLIDERTDPVGLLSSGAVNANALDEAGLANDSTDGTDEGGGEPTRLRLTG